VRQRACHGFLHHIDRQAQALGDLRIGQAVKLREQEGLAHRGRQPVEQARDVLERFEDQQPLFRRRGERHGLRAQRIKVGLLQCLAPPVVGDQPVGDGRQIGPGFAHIGGLALGKHPHEGVLRQVGGVEGIAQLAPQPRLQPAVVVAVQNIDAGG
jgi:hypothetical protein